MPTIDLNKYKAGANSPLDSTTSSQTTTFMGNPLTQPSAFIKTLADPARLSGALDMAKSSMERAGERLSRAGEEFKKGGANPFANPKASLALLGAGGEVAGIPYTAGIGLFKKEVGETAKGVLSLVPDSAKSKIKEGYDLLPDDLKKSAGDALASLGLLAVPGELRALSKISDKIGVGKLYEAAKTNLTATPASAIESQKQAILKTTDKNIEEFIRTNKSLINQTTQAKKLGTDIKAILKDPQLFKELKVVANRLDATNATGYIDDLLDKVTDSLDDLAPYADDFGTTIKRAELRKAIVDQVDDVLPVDKARIVDSIDDQLNAFPDELKISDVNKMRAKARLSARDAKGAYKDASPYSAIEKGARSKVFEAYSQLPFVSDAKVVPTLHTFVRDMLRTRDFLTKIDGVSLGAGKLGKSITKATGAIIGSKGGPVGSYIGSQVAGYIDDVLNNIQLGATVKADMIRKLFGDSPNAISQADDLLRSAGLYSPRQLSAPTSGAPQTQFGSTSTIELPAQMRQGAYANTQMGATPGTTRPPDFPDEFFPQAQGGQLSPNTPLQATKGQNISIDEAIQKTRPIQSDIKLGEGLKTQPKSTSPFGKESFYDDIKVGLHGEGATVPQLPQRLAGLQNGDFVMIGKDIAQVQGGTSAGLKVKFLSDGSSDIVTQFDKVTKATPYDITKATKGVSLEGIIEQGSGWPTGLKEKFDAALRAKDSTLIKSMLPQVPQEYIQRFSKEIIEIINQ